MLTRGDMVLYNGERGVICNTHPLVMRTFGLATYVPLIGRPRLLEAAFAPEERPLPDAVRARIVAWLRRHGHA